MKNATVLDVIRQPWPLECLVFNEPLNVHLELLEFSGCLAVEMIPKWIKKLRHFPSFLILPSQELPGKACLPNIHHFQISLELLDKFLRRSYVGLATNRPGALSKNGLECQS